MSELLTYVITSVVSMLCTGGLGSIIYFKQQKKLKAAEVRAAEVDIKSHEVEVKSQEISNLSNSNAEWIRLYNETKEEKLRLEEQLAAATDKLDEIYKSKDMAWDRYSDSRAECNKKDMVIAELNWYRCEVNGCPYRKPPRKYGEMEFPKDAIDPIEHPDPEYI